MRDPVRNSQAGAEVVIFGIPKISTVAVGSGKGDTAERTERIHSRKVVSAEPVVALGRPGLEIPPETEVDGQLRGRSPIILRVQGKIFLRESRRNVFSGPDPPLVLSRQQRGAVDAVLQIRRVLRSRATGCGGVLEREVTAHVRAAGCNLGCRLFQILIIR